MPVSENILLSPSAEFWAGVRAELPILLGGAPFGMIYGVLARQAGLSPEAAQGMSAIVFAGSAQFIATQLLQVGAPGLVIVLTIAVVNLRHALYSASLAPYLQKLNAGWKLLLAYLLTDEAYAVTVTHYTSGRAGPAARWYFLGAGLALWAEWQLTTALGIAAGALIPPSWGLDFSLALTFIALALPQMLDRPAAAAGLAAGIMALLTYGLPYKLGLMAAALTGILTGLALERRR